MENNAVDQTPGLRVDPVLDIRPADAERKPASRLRAGDLCPTCREANLDYDGLLNLACPNCGYALGGCFT